MEYYRNMAVASMILVFTPILVLAADIQTNVINPIGTLISSLIPILMTVAFLAFLWGLIKYISSAGDPQKAFEGKSIMIYGVIALFVMVSIWGLTSFIGGVFGISSTDEDGNSNTPNTNDLIPTGL